MSTHLEQLDTGALTPASALSLLRGRISAVECLGADSQAQIGIASDFHLADVQGKLALVCRVELDEEKHDKIKHLLPDGKELLYVGNHPLIGAVGP